MTATTTPAWRHARAARLRRLVLAAIAMLMATAGLTSLSPSSPAQAGEAQASGSLVAAIYNDSMFAMELVKHNSTYGWRTLPDVYIGPEDAGLFDIAGTSPTIPMWCSGSFKNHYDGFFTYQVNAGAHLGRTEYITFAIWGMRQKGWGACNDVQPNVDVYVTSTMPPDTWRGGNGAPPNVIDSDFDYQHNVPQLFDQTITWEGEGPGVGVPAIVSLGDSTISGEGGRWAGNANIEGGRVDAGSTWYWDTPSGESIEDCHRAKSALVHIGGPYRTQNFACSAAETGTHSWYYSDRGWRFKPGLDKYCGGRIISGYECAGTDKSQLMDLHHYAKTHNVTNVVLAIGANDFDFSDIVATCVTLYFERKLNPNGERCTTDPGVQQKLSSTKQREIENEIVHALDRVAFTMRDAGYTKDMYRIIMQNYWSPIPPDSAIRIPDDGLRRDVEGGCPVLWGDATWMNTTLLPIINDTVKRAFTRFKNVGIANTRFLDVSDALKGHRLCENGVALIENQSIGTRGTDRAMADALEWVTQMRVGSEPPYMVAEGGHANYWGQLAQRNCLRLLIASSHASAKCVPYAGFGTNGFGEPRMVLSAL